MLGTIIGKTGNMDKEPPKAFSPVRIIVAFAMPVSL
jgi:hypothetical protein